MDIVKFLLTTMPNAHNLEQVENKYYNVLSYRFSHCVLFLNIEPSILSEEKISHRILSSSRILKLAKSCD